MRDTSHAATFSDPLSVLNTVFGYPALRGQQADIVAHVAAGNKVVDSPLLTRGGVPRIVQ